ncbi:hypothetical protein [Burkholderia cepacia]|uniref:hypothetical protein n=1 Tax=Burkholderia cepacia TaxID=292 RepID=UPI000AD48FC6
METLNSSAAGWVPWNKSGLAGQKPPLKLREIWAIRTRLETSSNIRELASFNLAIVAVPEERLRTSPETSVAAQITRST